MKIAVNCWVLRNRQLDGIGYFTVNTISRMIKNHPEVHFMLICDKDFTGNWFDFYHELFGFTQVPHEQRFGILPKGSVLRSPCGTFYLQLIEPEPGILEVEGDETLARVAFGTPDVLGAASLLRSRGMAFVESNRVHTDPRGALMEPAIFGVTFELVHVES